MRITGDVVMSVRYGALQEILRRSCALTGRRHEPLNQPPTRVEWDPESEQLYATFPNDCAYIHRVQDEVVLEVRGDSYAVIDAAGRVVSVQPLRPERAARDPFTVAREQSFCEAPEWN
jgi:hypothetical protein